MAAVLLIGGCEADVFNFSGAQLKPGANGPWVNEGVSDAAKQRDLEQCWTVSRAQVSRDRRIDRDIAPTGSDRGPAPDSPDLQRAMTEMRYDRRRDEVVAQCMREKGYTRK